MLNPKTVQNLWGFGSPFHETFYSASVCELEIMSWQLMIIYEHSIGNATCIVSEGA